MKVNHGDAILVRIRNKWHAAVVGPPSSNYVTCDRLDGLGRCFVDPKMIGKRIKRRDDRPSWQQTWMSVAATIARRSHDPSTKHGAVIVDSSNRILGAGYNGFPRGGPDNYSTERPEKYARFIHAETNAILNCQHRPEGGTLYVTGVPCPNCMGNIIQAGIVRVVYGGIESAMVDGEAAWTTEELARDHNVELVRYA